MRSKGLQITSEENLDVFCMIYQPLRTLKKQRLNIISSVQKRQEEKSKHC